MKVVNISILWFFLTLLFFNCSRKLSDEPKIDCINESLIDSQALCYEIYAPVCGCNDKTYSNDCKALNNGILRYEEGECS